MNWKKWVKKADQELSCDWNWMASVAFGHCAFMLVVGAATDNFNIFLVEALFVTIIIRSWWRGRADPRHILGAERAWKFVTDTVRDFKKNKDPSHEQNPSP